MRSDSSQAHYRLLVRSGVMLVSALLCLALSLCYWRRPDACAALTAWPAWLWFLPGLAVTLSLWRRRGGRTVYAVLALWCLFVVIFAEEPVSLLRFRAWPDPAWEAARARGRGARIVSLNCAGGDENAAAEVAQYHPDIVLLQESPSAEALRRLTRTLFGQEGAVLPGVDGSLLVRGTLQPRPVPRGLRSTLVHAHVRLTTGFEAEVVSMRLLPILFHPDLWSSEAWRDQTRNRRQRRQQVREVAAQIAPAPRDVPLIVGGDCNAAAGDAALWPLRPRLRDTFPEAGLGWGGTGTNEAPVLRIDQVWVSEQLRPTGVVARRTRNSDHRLVVCDVVLRD